MSTPENAPTAESSREALVTFNDGSTAIARRLDRPGVLVRIERAYPDIEYTGDEAPAGFRRPSVFYFMVWCALRLDHAPGDASRPSDDFDEWIDTVSDVEPIEDPTDEPAAPEKQSEPAEKPTGGVEKPREPMVAVAAPR